MLGHKGGEEERTEPCRQSGTTSCDLPASSTVASDRTTTASASAESNEWKEGGASGGGGWEGLYSAARALVHNRISLFFPVSSCSFARLVRQVTTIAPPTLFNREQRRKDMNLLFAFFESRDLQCLFWSKFMEQNRCLLMCFDWSLSFGTSIRIIILRNK